MSILLDVYVFLAWVGAWSAYSGWSAFVVAVGWTAFVIFAIVASLFGGWLAILKVLTGHYVFCPLVGIAAWILYFFGLGDWMTGVLPNMFPKGGYLFTDASAVWYEHLILWAWILMRSSTLRFLGKM